MCLASQLKGSYKDTLTFEGQEEDHLDSSISEGSDSNKSKQISIKKSEIELDYKGELLGLKSPKRPV